MTLGFPDHLNKWELSDAYREAYLVEPKIIPHEIVDDGPVLENVLTGDDIDVTKFPSPIWHEKDGGRYIGTGTYSITRDPEENWLNAGAYRAMVHDKTSVGFVTARGHHGYIHREKYWARGEAMPVVMVLGGDPLAFFYGGVEAPYGTFELDIVGGMRGRPTKMVRGKVTGLPFPANAEIVLEGYVTPDRRKDEGPFGEWTGHYAGGVRPIPVLDIKAIYHRNDPILLGVPPMGGGPDEMARYRAVMRSAMIKQNMTNAGVPGVAAGVVSRSRRARASSTPSRSRSAIPATPCRRCTSVRNAAPRLTRPNMSSWSTTTSTSPISNRPYGRCSAAPTPRSSIQFITGSWDSSADPALPPDRRAVGNFTHSVALINACKPWHWREKFPPSNTPSHGRSRARRRKNSAG